MTISELASELDKLVKNKKYSLNTEIKICFNEEPFPLRLNGFTDDCDDVVIMELGA